MISYNKTPNPYKGHNTITTHRKGGVTQVALYKLAEYTSAGRVGWFDCYIVAVCDTVEEVERVVAESVARGMNRL